MNADLKRGSHAPLLLVVAVVVQLLACSPCGDESLYSVTAPGGKLVATTFIRNCGATTDYASIVTLHTNSGKGTNDIVFSAKGDHRIELSWKDAEHLVVDCRSCEEQQVFTRVTKRGAIEIGYSR